MTVKENNLDILDRRIDRLVEEQEMHAPEIIIEFEKNLIKKSFEDLIKSIN